MKTNLLATGIFLLSLWLSLSGETVKDREGAVRQDRAAREKDPRWVYNEIPQGFAEARRTGKPVLVVLRCVPCLACAGIDTQVLLENTEITPLMDQFVCVRVINANALDLSLFQFDYDLSFSTLFFNGDGTIYGRYGSWSHQTNAQNTATAGFKRALEAALVLHQAYPKNRTALAGKQGVPGPYETPVQIPGLAGKYTVDLNWNGKVVPSCVHCHQIGDGLRLSLREQHQPIPPKLIYPMPAPETIGLKLAPEQIAHIDSVTPGSVAAIAGLKAGDELISLAGQPLISVADVSWALHQAPESGFVPGVRRRASAEQPFQLTLTNGWRNKSDIAGRVGTWGLRGMAIGGLVLEDLTDEQRVERHRRPTDLALAVKYVGEYGKHAAAKKAGFEKGDLLVELDGQSVRMTEGELIGTVLQKHAPGEFVRATVLRGPERVELKLPVQ